MSPLNTSPLYRQYETLPSLNVPGIPAVAPLPTGETDDTRLIAERFGEDIIASGLHNGNQVVYVQPSRLVELAQFINRDAQLKYESLIDVCAVDRLKLPIGPDDARFQGVYQFRSYSVLADSGISI